MDDKDNNRASGRPDFVDLSFAYDNKNFSDRILRIKTVLDVHEVSSDEDRTASLKPKNDDQKTTFGVKTMHVNSAILVVKSPFFFKLFSNGMQESEQSDVTVCISCSEEEAFMELLNFIYCGTLVSPKTTAVVLDILKVADKFQVPSCICQCVAMLQSMIMTLESVSLILSLPSCVQMIDVVQQLVKEANGFLKNHSSQMKRFEEEYMQLPLVVIEEVLSSDEFQVESEDHLFDSVMKWAKTHYPNDAERREVLRNKLIKWIQFPQMSYMKLTELLLNEEIRGITLEQILNAILFKDEPSSSRKRKSCTLNQNGKRAFKRCCFRPIKVVKFDTGVREYGYKVFWSIKIDQFLTIPSDERKYQSSHIFCLMDQPFHLIAYHRGNEQSIRFCIRLDKELKDPLNFGLDYSFSVQSNPDFNFWNFSKVFQGLLVNIRNVSKLEGSIPIADNDPYVINNTIHLQAVFTPRLR